MGGLASLGGGHGSDCVPDSTAQNTSENLFLVPVGKHFRRIRHMKGKDTLFRNDGAGVGEALGSTPVARPQHGGVYVLNHPLHAALRGGPANPIV